MAYDFEFEVAVGETKTFDLSSITYGASINNITYVGDARTYVTCVENASDNSRLDVTGKAEGVAAVDVSAGRLALSVQVTVTAASVDDQNFLNERGLAHFWQGVNAAKQDKLPSGTVLTTRTELYNNNSGSAANISVSQALNNFDLVEFWFIDANSPANQLVRTIPGDAVGVVLDIPHPGGSSTVYWNVARWTWTAGATTLTYSSNHYQKALATSSLSTSSTNYILIRKVVGIKFTTL